MRRAAVVEMRHDIPQTAKEVVWGGHPRADWAREQEHGPMEQAVRALLAPTLLSV